MLFAGLANLWDVALYTKEAKEPLLTNSVLLSSASPLFDKLLRGLTLCDGCDKKISVILPDEDRVAVLFLLDRLHASYQFLLPDRLEECNEDKETRSLSRRQVTDLAKRLEITQGLFEESTKKFKKVEHSLEMDFSLEPGQEEVACVDLASPEWREDTRITRHPDFQDNRFEFISGTVGEGGDHMNIKLKNISEETATIRGDTIVVVVDETPVHVNKFSKAPVCNKYLSSKKTSNHIKKNKKLALKKKIKQIKQQIKEHENPIDLKPIETIPDKGLVNHNTEEVDASNAAKNNNIIDAKIGYEPCRDFCQNTNEYEASDNSFELEAMGPEDEDNDEIMSLKITDVCSVLENPIQDKEQSTKDNENIPAGRFNSTLPPTDSSAQLTTKNFRQVRHKPATLTGLAKGKNKPARVSRFCGDCKPCQILQDCGECTFCLDKPKFGGPGIKKQKCELRWCDLHPRLNRGPGCLRREAIKCNDCGEEYHTFRFFNNHMKMMHDKYEVEGVFCKIKDPSLTIKRVDRDNNVHHWFEMKDTQIAEDEQAREIEHDENNQQVNISNQREENLLMRQVRLEYSISKQYMCIFSGAGNTDFSRRITNKEAKIIDTQLRVACFNNSNTKDQ